MVKSLKAFLCFGLLLAVACLAAPLGAIASDSLFIDNQNTSFTLAGTNPYDGDIRLISPDTVALVPSDTANGMKDMDFAASYWSSVGHAIIKSVNSKGGAAPACSKPLVII